MFVTQTPDDEIFLRSRHVRMQHAQHHVHKASSSNSDEQAVFYYPIKNASARYSICTRRKRDIKNICPEHFLLLIFQKACIPEPTGKPTCIILHRGSISLFLSFLFSFFVLPFHDFHHHHLASFPSHHHGARGTADGSRVMDGVECKCGTS